MTPLETIPSADIATNLSVPVAPYIDPHYFDLERKHIFGRAWLNAGRVEELARPGDYLVVEMPWVPTSIIVTRAADGLLRAFHNVCSHRGNQLCADSCGFTRAFVCSFHRWTYDLSGQLKSVPSRAGFGPTFTLEQHGLSEIAVDTWAGFVFVNLDPNPAWTLADYLSDLVTDLDGYPFAEAGGSHYRWTSTVAANWKLAKDAFQEIYHVPTLHRRSVAPYFVAKDNPFNRPLDVTCFERHARMSVPFNPDYAAGATEAIALRRGMRRLDRTPRPKGLNPTRHKNWSFDINVVFPNFFLDMFANSYFTYRFVPVTVDQTIFEVDVYLPKAETPSERFRHEYSLVAFRDALAEDASTLEASQRALQAGVLSTFTLHQDEIMIKHSHDVGEAMIHGD